MCIILREHGGGGVSSGGVLYKDIFMKFGGLNRQEFFFKKAKCKNSKIVVTT